MSQQQVPDESPNPPPNQSESHSEGTVAPDARTPFFKASNAERYQRQEVIKQIQAHISQISRVGAS